MSEKFISPRKRLAMGDKPNKYKEGGFVTPRGQVERPEADVGPGKHFKDDAGRVGGGTRKPAVPEYADDVRGDGKKPAVVTRGGRRIEPKAKIEREDIEPRHKSKTKVDE